jgi:hypothetical protein
MPNQNDYMLVTENISRIDDFNKEVNRLLSEGWKLHGNTQVTSLTDVVKQPIVTAVISQALVFSESTNDVEFKGAEEW